MDKFAVLPASILATDDEETARRKAIDVIRGSGKTVLLLKVVDELEPQPVWKSKIPTTTRISGNRFTLDDKVEVRVDGVGAWVSATVVGVKLDGGGWLSYLCQGTNVTEDWFESSYVRSAQQLATPPAAAEPERFQVGERVEALYNSRGWADGCDPGAKDGDWRVAKVTKNKCASDYQVSFDCDKDARDWPMHSYQVRRPIAAPVAAAEPFKFGQVVMAGKSESGVDYSGVEAFFLSVNREGLLRVAVNANLRTFDFFTPDQVHHIEAAPSA